MAVDAPARAPGYTSLATLYTCVLLVALSLTWIYLGMRSVMDIGGACAEGGPYVTAQPCPDAAAVLLSLGVPLMMIAAFVGTAAAVPHDAPNLIVPMWGFLFGALGWNFLEYGVLTDGIVWGWLLSGVVFEAMAIPAFLVMLPVGRRDWTSKVRPQPDAEHASLRWAATYALLGVVGVGLAVWSNRAWS